MPRHFMKNQISSDAYDTYMPTYLHISNPCSSVAFEHSRCDLCARHVTIKARQTAQLTADMSNDVVIIPVMRNVSLYSVLFR